MDRGAIFDETATYRYHLSRRWGRGGLSMTFVMLNPSTADAFKEDPTITRCIGFAKREGYNALEIVNLFALRATNPAELLSASEPAGECNDDYVRHSCRNADQIVCAWGAHTMAAGRARHVWDAAIRLAKYSHDTPVVCLGTTKDGHPKHPLYLAADTPLAPFTPAWIAEPNPF